MFSIYKERVTWRLHFLNPMKKSVDNNLPGSLERHALQATPYRDVGLCRSLLAEVTEKAEFCDQPNGLDIHLLDLPIKNESRKNSRLDI